MIECCFKAVTFSTAEMEENLQLLMTILRRSTPKGSTLSYLASYEGIKMFYANQRVEPRQENDSIAVKTQNARSDAEMEFDQGIAALLLHNWNSPTENDWYFPLAGNSNTESIRVARARAVLAFVLSADMKDTQEKTQALMAVKLWLKSERSGQVRDILHEAGACI